MEKNRSEYHIPVMLDECLEGLNINPDGVYVDVTFGGGGHSKAIFEQLSPKGKLIVFDQDSDVKANLWEADNFYFVESNFSFLQNHLKLLNIPYVDGILADLGVSSHQFDQGTRGFSIRSNDALDMRMNQNAEISAKNIVNEYEAENLARIFNKYGEVKSPMRIAREIVSKRASRPIETTGDLIEILEPLAPKFKEHKFYAQIFQAIRIEVNNEMKVLEDFLLQTTDVLKDGGRLVVMSYHSLEDRLVKNFMKRGSLDGTIDKDFFGNVLKPLTEVNRHPIEAKESEIEKNSRARSAKLRISIRNGRK
jgi:16S rRNA (cytosine1402-N4)-methyltransferase